MMRESDERHNGGPRVLSPEEDGETERNETPLERLDRNMQELLSELRIVVTGVQVLFAFLLVVPFNVGFAHIGPFQRGVYFVTLLLAALAAVCMLAPAAQHRILFRCDEKEYIVFISNRLMLAGLGFLALAMCGSLMLVATKLFGVETGVITVAIAAIPFVVIWFLVPLRRKARPSRPAGPRGRAGEERRARGELRVGRVL